MTVRYLADNLIEFEVVCIDTDSGDSVVPGVLTFSFLQPGGTLTTPCVYTNAVSPVVNVIACVTNDDGEIAFRVWVDTTGLISGPGQGKWRSTGVGQGAQNDDVYIDANN